MDVSLDTGDRELNEMGFLFQRVHRLEERQGCQALVKCSETSVHRGLWRTEGRRKLELW